MKRKGLVALVAAGAIAAGGAFYGLNSQRPQRVEFTPLTFSNAYKFAPPIRDKNARTITVPETGETYKITANEEAELERKYKEFGPTPISAEKFRDKKWDRSLYVRYILVERCTELTDHDLVCINRYLRETWRRRIEISKLLEVTAWDRLKQRVGDFVYDLTH
jgi:hypothetical protein